MMKALKIVGIVLASCLALFLFMGLLLEQCGNPNEGLTPVDSAKADSTSVVQADRLRSVDAPKPPHLIVSIDTLRVRFNKYNQRHGFDHRIGEVVINEGEVNNTFRYQFNDALGILGSLNKQDNSIKEITMIAAGDSGEDNMSTGVNILSLMAAIIHSADPSNEPKDNKLILQQLGILNEQTTIIGLKESTVRNNVKYWVNCSEEIGLWFGASLPD